jgi:signal transduction histidine kinase
MEHKPHGSPQDSAPQTVRPVHLQTLVRAQMRAAEFEADRRGDELDLSISGQPRPVRVDAARVSQAIGGLLLSAVRFSSPGAHLQAGVGFGSSQAIVSVGLEGDVALEVERSGVLHESLAEARSILEDYGGTLRISGRWLSASLPLAV